LEGCADTIFKVSFHKKLDQKLIESKLKEIKYEDIKKGQNMKQITKNLIEGELVEITGHLLESENNLGRSLVVDLNAPKENNLRYVDHRTIEYIIFKNVKYSLGRKTETEELPIRHDKDLPRWDQSKLKVGDWFSQIQYYKVKKIIDK
jgi:hypothetical protein